MTTYYDCSLTKRDAQFISAIVLHSNSQDVYTESKYGTDVSNVISLLNVSRGRKMTLVNTRGGKGYLVSLTMTPRNLAENIGTYNELTNQFKTMAYSEVLGYVPTIQAFLAAGPLLPLDKEHPMVACHYRSDLVNIDQVYASPITSFKMHDLHSVRHCTMTLESGERITKPLPFTVSKLDGLPPVESGYYYVENGFGGYEIMNPTELHNRIEFAE